MSSPSPPSKRIRLDSRSVSPSSASPRAKQHDEEIVADKEEVQEEEEDNCAICLQPKADRTVLPSCSHEFCFECIVVWCGKNFGLSFHF